MTACMIFLKQYMALEDRILAEFFHEEADSVYRYDTLYAPEYYGDGQYHGYETGERLYQSFSFGLAVEKDEVSEYSEEFLGFAVTKIKVCLDSQKETREITVKTNECGAPLEITRSKNVMSDEEDELFYSFEGVWIDVPTPFQKGDIVFTNHQKYGLPPDPFVLTKLCTDNETEQDQKTYKRLLKYGDSSDMTLYGYRLFRGGGEIRHECDHDYLSVEYYDRKLVGYGRVLDVIQAFFRDELDIGGCMTAYHYILLDEMTRNREKYEGEYILQKTNGGVSG